MLISIKQKCQTYSWSCLSSPTECVDILVLLLYMVAYHMGKVILLLLTECYFFLRVANVFGNSFLKSSDQVASGARAHRKHWQRKQLDNACGHPNDRITHTQTDRQTLPTHVLYIPISYSLWIHTLVHHLLRYILISSKVFILINRPSDELE